MNTSAIARSTDLELAAWGHPCATLRIGLVELSNLGRGDDRLPALLDAAWFEIWADRRYGS